MLSPAGFFRRQFDRPAVLGRSGDFAVRARTRVWLHCITDSSSRGFRRCLSLLHLGVRRDAGRRLQLLPSAHLFADSALCAGWLHYLPSTCRSVPGS